MISSSVQPHLLRRNSLKIPQSSGVEGAAVWVQKWVTFIMGFALNASEGGVVEGGAVLVQKWVTFMLGFALNGSGGNKEIAMDRGWHANGTSFVISRFHIK